VNATVLTVHLGERTRIGGSPASELLGWLFATAGVRTAVLLRGTEGYGLHRALHTRRVLSLSEDLPLVWVVVDAPGVVGPLAASVDRMLPSGLLTLERAVAWEGGDGEKAVPPAADGDGTARATVYLGRTERTGGRLAIHAVVDRLRDHGVEGAGAYIGVDGVRGGRRHRARLARADRRVPAAVVAVGDRGRLVAALADLRGVLPADAALTLERVRLLRRDGEALAPPPPPPAAAAKRAGPAPWWRLTVLTGTDRTVPGGDEPLHTALVRSLAQAGAGGATSTTGVWGYSGDGPAHGDRMLALRRRVPVSVVCVDAPARIAALWPVVERLTARSGLVTLESVPAARAGTAGPDDEAFGISTAP
jgi:PII-like signaling protein